MTERDDAKVERVARAMRDDLIRRESLVEEAVPWTDTRDHWMAMARAALAAAEPQWQPIATAPKDGTRVLVVNAERDQIGTAVFARLEWELVHPISGEMMGLGLYPTHWMRIEPLPLPPGGDNE